MHSDTMRKDNKNIESRLEIFYKIVNPHLVDTDGFLSTMARVYKFRQRYMWHALYKFYCVPHVSKIQNWWRCIIDEYKRKRAIMIILNFLNNLILKKYESEYVFV